MSLEAWGDEVPDEGAFDRAIEAGWINPADQSKALIDVMNERARQHDEEGWTPEHDDSHASGELAQAAVCYADTSDGLTLRELPRRWPLNWHPRYWKPSIHRRNLVKAAALILAEIERLDRASAKGAAQ